MLVTTFEIGSWIAEQESARHEGRAPAGGPVLERASCDSGHADCFMLLLKRTVLGTGGAGAVPNPPTRAGGQ